MSLEDWTVRVEEWHGTARMPRNLDETGEMINCENSTLTLVSRFSLLLLLALPTGHSNVGQTLGGWSDRSVHLLSGRATRQTTNGGGGQPRQRKEKKRAHHQLQWHPVGTGFGSPSASFPPVSVGKCISVFWNFGILEFLSPSPPLRTFSRSLETAPYRSCELSGKLFLLHPYISHDTVHREFRVTCSPQLIPR